MLRKDADNRALDDHAIIENIRCDVLDSLALVIELRLPIARQYASLAAKLVHRDAADLAFDCLAFVQHRKPERHFGYVVTHSFAPHERHRKLPRTTPKMLCPAGFVEPGCSAFRLGVASPLIVLPAHPQWVSEKPITLNGAGVDKNLAKRARKLHALPKEEFYPDDECRDPAKKRPQRGGS
jgi:hypothetical protein